MLKRNGLILCATLLWALVPCPPTLAVPAAPGLVILTQPGGQAFEARQWGDEWSHGWETKDGFAVLRNEFSREWVYAVRDQTGELRESAAPVGFVPPPTSTKPGLRPATALLDQRRTDRAQALAVAPIHPGIAVNGVANVLTILVNFTDRVVTYGHDHRSGHPGAGVQGFSLGWARPRLKPWTPENGRWP